MELSEIYVNIERPAENRTKRVRGINNSESIYENVLNKKKEPNWTYTRSAQKVAGDVRKTSCNTAVVFLCLLCLLLLVTVITLVCLFIETKYKLEMKMNPLHTSYQPSTSNNYVTQERDQSLTSNNYVTQERDQSLTSNNDVTQDRDQSHTFTAT